MLLSFAPGVEFLYAFLATLYAGCIAVPAYPPRRRGSLSRLEAIAANSQANLVLSSSEVMSDLPDFESSSLLQFLSVGGYWNDEGNANQWQAPRLTNRDLAFLQSTSGSTGNPKGVQVSHKNCLATKTLSTVFLNKLRMKQ